MTKLPDLADLTFDQRMTLANRVKSLSNFQLPALEYWNDRPCDKHTTIQFTCKECAIRPMPHQAVGSTWLYFAKKGLLADSMGTGKTANLSLLIAMMVQAGELDNGRRVIIAVRSPAINQWERELNRSLRNIKVITGLGTTQKRLAKYLSDWQVLVIGKEMAIQDWEALEQFPIAAVIMDDVDAIRNPTKTAHALKKLARNSPRVVIANGTPLMKRLPELYHTLEPLGGRAVFSTKGAFKARYMDTDTDGKPTYKNIQEFKNKLAPFVLRRTTDDLDAEMPSVMSSTIWLELHPAQRAKYQELRSGVLKILKESGKQEVKRIQALQQFHYGAAVCSGLVAIGEQDEPGRNSSKLDWIDDALANDLSDDKVIIFIGTKKLLTAAETRLNNSGISTAKIWGEDNNRIRQEEIDRFWDDDKCQVLLMTQAGESSLNLQNARHVIFCDTILNPARMAQILGRARRQGSKHKTVYAHHLLTRDTQEEAYLGSLRREAALADAVWNSSNEIFAPLSPIEMLRLIAS